MLHVALLILCMLAIALPARAARPAGYLRGFTQTRAIIETSGRVCLMLEIYLADSPEQHRQGLMFIDQMDEFEGMLFRYDQNAMIHMWMKNTHIPLDMVFIRGDGEIAGIARRTTPMSTQRISSPEPVPFVLELNGGMTERWQIEPGNRLLTIN
jgi:uncharacterized membrane protein (UPF0127 family)